MQAELKGGLANGHITEFELHERENIRVLLSSIGCMMDLCVILIYNLHVPAVGSQGKVVKQIGEVPYTQPDQTGSC